MYQIVDGTFHEAKRYCIHDHTVVEAGRWHDLRACWFNGLYMRVIPSHAVELTSAYLHRQVASILERQGIRAATLRQKQDLAGVIHLCGARAGAVYAGRGFAKTPRPALRRSRRRALSREAARPAAPVHPARDRKGIESRVLRELTLSTIREARRRIAPFVLRTPVLQRRPSADCELLLKAESLQSDRRVQAARRVQSHAAPAQELCRAWSRTPRAITRRPSRAPRASCACAR